MNILFLAGSLELGKDGVGDYTRALADECQRMGQRAFLVSLNDGWVEKSGKPPPEPTVLRLGASLAPLDRLQAVRSFLADNRPDIVSLQFVPYAFNPTGLPFTWPRMFDAMIGRVTVQIMFHEIWIGAHLNAPLRSRAIGFGQRWIVQSLVRRLNCRVIHTSNPVYVRLLNNQGIGAKHLPLFGSVPIAPSAGSPRRHDDILRLGMFGSIHPEWSPDEMFSHLRKLGRSIQLTHIGRIGPGESVWARSVKQYGSEIGMQRLGERPALDISRFLLSVDLGISTSPLSLIGKSGSVATMLDHGLPVIVNRNDIHFAGISETELMSDLLIPMDENFLPRVASVKPIPPKARLPEIASQFLRDIGA